MNKHDQLSEALNNINKSNEMLEEMLEKSKQDLDYKNTMYFLEDERKKESHHAR